MKTQRMNRWDSMLAWLSLKSQNKWPNVKTNSQRLSAIEFPDREWSPLRHAMEWAGVLIQLGHAEFDSSNRTVAAIAPGLLALPKSGRAILYGYWDAPRSKALGEFGFTRLRHRPDRGPTCHSIAIDDANLMAVSQTLGVWIANECSVGLMQRIPILSSILEKLEPSQISGGGYWERFDYRSDLYGQWRSCDQPLMEPGLFQRKEGQAVQIYVDSELMQFSLKSLDEKTAAKWFCYQPRFDWIFDDHQNSLFIPHGTPALPVLVSRGLTMKSARLPKRVAFGGRKWWKYTSVGEQQVREAARVMEQELVTRSITNV